MTAQAEQKRAVASNHKEGNSHGSEMPRTIPFFCKWPGEGASEEDKPLQTSGYYQTRSLGSYPEVQRQKHQGLNTRKSKESKKKLQEKEKPESVIQKDADGEAIQDPSLANEITVRIHKPKDEQKGALGLGAIPGHLWEEVGENQKIREVQGLRPWGKPQERVKKVVS